MSKISKMADRLVIEQDLNAMCISRTAKGGLEIMEHCVANEAEENASFFVFNAQEKQVLLEYLLEDALQVAAKTERHVKKQTQPQS